MSPVSEGFACPGWSAAERRIDRQGGDRLRKWWLVTHRSWSKYGLIVTVITIAICVLPVPTILPSDARGQL
jgi:hypothetical protein